MCVIVRLIVYSGSTVIGTNSQWCGKGEEKVVRVDLFSTRPRPRRCEIRDEPHKVDTLGGGDKNGRDI